MAHPDINKALTSDGRTALIMSQKGHTEIVEKLMARPDITSTRHGRATGARPSFLRARKATPRSSRS